MYAKLALLLCILSGTLGADEWPRVDTIFLEKVSLPLQLQLDGTLHPHRQAELACEVGGTIAAKEVLIGQHIEQGDVLLRLDAQRFALLRQMRSAELDAARSSALLAGQSWQRVRQLHAEDTASDEELERATFEKASAAARVQAASAALRMAELDLHNSALRAPFSGEIAAIYGEVGEAVAAGQPLVRLAATDTVLVRAAVSSEEVQLLSNGLLAQNNVGQQGNRLDIAASPANIRRGNGSNPFFDFAVIGVAHRLRVSEYRRLNISRKRMISGCCTTCNL